MDKKLFVVKYSGPFGFIKPWTAVRDGETYSQQFLTPSIVEGMEKKLFPEILEQNGLICKIKRYKLQYSSINVQQEQTQTRGWEKKSKEKMMVRNQSVLKRGVMINPKLFLAFDNKEDADIASKQHLCLCRNEDILLPGENILALNEDDFERIDGFELRFGVSEQSFWVGYNRMDENKPMYGWLEMSGKPVLDL